MSSLRLFICAWIQSHLLEQPTRGHFSEENWPYLPQQPSSVKVPPPPILAFWLAWPCASNQSYWVHKCSAPLCLHNACLEGILPNFLFSSSFALFHNVSQEGRRCDRKVPFKVALHSYLLSALWPAGSFYVHHHTLMKVYGFRDNLIDPMSVYQSNCSRFSSRVWLSNHEFLVGFIVLDMNSICGSLNPNQKVVSYPP